MVRIRNIQYTFFPHKTCVTIPIWNECIFNLQFIIYYYHSQFDFSDEWWLSGFCLYKMMINYSMMNDYFKHNSKKVPCIESDNFRTAKSRTSNNQLVSTKIVISHCLIEIERCHHNHNNEHFVIYCLFPLLAALTPQA